MTKIGTINNFDLLRFFAATEVAFRHATAHLDYSNSILSWVSAFPGVPIFFFLSGLLIYGSYESSFSSVNPLRVFYLKRILRLYPGLWACFIFSLLLLWISGYLLENLPTKSNLLFWAGTQVTFLQFYNPEFLYAFGVGVLNGSLWTIVVEIQFYLLFPLIYWLLKRNLILVISILLIFIIFNHINIYFNNQDTLFGKLFNVSFIPWLYMFLFGAITAHFVKMRVWMMNRSLSSIFLLYFLIYFLSKATGIHWGTTINPLGFFLLTIICMRLAFLIPNFSNRYLNKNDISYGIYIYHMPIINFILYMYGVGIIQFYLAMTFTYICAIFSWYLIERPLLKRKSFALRKN